MTQPREVREAIMSAALVVFTEYTYGGTAMAPLAERAGVAVGSIYRHFPSKEALGNAVYRRWKTRLGAHVIDSVAADVADEPIRARFGRMWRGMVAFAVEHPDAFAFLELQQHQSYLDAENAALTERIYAAAGELISAGQARGEIRPGDPTVLMSLAYGAFIGMCASMRGSGLDEERLALSENAVWDLLRCP
ncbi:TetR family transcriptional regulator [Virgisporangium aliadipatigenens]|uniref:TetR family transcriptional regulator n=1 Tax=Virgisporangium aliadipatigenens TaxID=741659 RepID=A0A8J3YLX6_9ACTN|nr:TetR/AcrR family transcriptional regulator [Virgisporangium aliadipatigenens]GIJ46281.1 TetR family transcriptional regulator [Virgisporangium aliadipatigenens]